jgi:hypothetical protein
MTKFQYALSDGRSVLSTHPNEEGARLSALFHVANGEAIRWERQPQYTIGTVSDKQRFKIELQSFTRR